MEYHGVWAGRSLVLVPAQLGGAARGGRLGGALGVMLVLLAALLGGALGVKNDVFFWEDGVWTREYSHCSLFFLTQGTHARTPFSNIALRIAVRYQCERAVDIQIHFASRPTITLDLPLDYVPSSIYGSTPVQSQQPTLIHRRSAPGSSLDPLWTHPRTHCSGWSCSAHRAA